MGLHFSSGRVLLKNTDDSEWYYLSASIGSDLLPHISVAQVIAGDFSLEDYDEYVVLRCADNDTLYKLGLETAEDASITYSFEPSPSPAIYRPIRLFVKDTSTGILYEITAKQDAISGEVYPQILAYSGANNTTIAKAQRCSAAVSILTPACLSPAEVMTHGTIIIPPANNAGRSHLLQGEGGEAIGAESGGGISGE
jgi:hypothetical protein